MKKYKRRKFLLFVGQLSTITFVGSSIGCSNQKHKKHMLDLKAETLKILKAGKEITLEWDCGGDEAIISTFMDRELMDYRDPFVEQLYIYLVNYLNLPSVGEFDLEGIGK